MTYSAFELSAQLGRPVELYTFTDGLTVYRYTSAEDEVAYGGETFYPRQIDRSVPKLSSDARTRVQLEITIPGEDPIATRFIGIVPAAPLQVEVLRFHRTDSPNGWIEWQGRVVNAKFENNGSSCRLFSVASERKLSRSLPNFKYHSLCNHVLYDAGCRAVKNSFKFTAPVSSVSGRQITVTGVSAFGASWALGGVVEYHNDARPVVVQSGDVLTLSLPFYDNVDGVTVDVYAGCDHSLSTCNSKFANTINFGGFPFVPTKNPFNTGL